MILNRNNNLLLLQIATMLKAITIEFNQKETKNNSHRVNESVNGYDEIV